MQQRGVRGGKLPPGVISRRVEGHRCPMPAGDTGYQKLDIWECPLCGQRYIADSWHSEVTGNGGRIWVVISLRRSSRLIRKRAKQQAKVDKMESQ